MADEVINKIIIIGSGPAAYNAAIYLSQCDPVIIEGKYIGNNGPGGQLTTTTLVDNFPGHYNISGPDLVQEMQEHANATTISGTVIGVTKEDGIFHIKTEEAVYKSYTVIVATGASAKRLFVPGSHDDEFWMKGISSCAVCDGWAYKDMICCVIGGGDTAFEETQYLSTLAKKVYLVHRRDDFRGRRDTLSKIERLPNVEILRCCNLAEVKGDDVVTHLVLDNLRDGSKFSIEVDGLFFGIGHTPNTGFLPVDMELAGGYIVVNENMQTSIEGVFAAGDVQDTKYRQANTAAASGCLAALSAIKYLSNLEIN